MSAPLDRFKRAQDADDALARAQAELRSGAKRGHWIWYVLPQLRGLGTSSLAERFGLDGADEARAYLADPVLSARLAETVAIVHDQACGRGVTLERLMGSAIDARKCVSCLTLVEQVVPSLAEPRSAEIEKLATQASAILDVAAGQGLPRCAFTLRETGA